MIVLPDPSAVLYDLVQGQDQTIEVSVLNSAGVAPNFASPDHTANFTLYEKLGGGQLEYFASGTTAYEGGSRITFHDGPSSATGINIKLMWDNTQSTPILATSRKRNNILLYGDLRVFLTSLSSTSPAYIKQMKFSFRQTLQGS